MRLFLFVVVSAAALNAQEAAPHGRLQGPPSDMVQRGRSQFVKSCGFCHGPAATGGASGPNLVRSALVRHDKGGDLIGSVIRDGRPDRGMPAIPLSSAQIADVVAFIHSRLLAADRTSAGRPKRDYDEKLLLIGDPKRGEAFFNGAGGCFKCHSPSGDLAGIAKKYPAVELQARFLYPSGAHATASVTLDSGNRITGQLLRLTNYDIAVRDADGWYHSWPLNSVKVEVDDPLLYHRELLPKYTDTEMHDMFAYLETLQ